MKKRVLIHTIEIVEQGQKVSFQINLPRDARKIVSVFHSIILISDSSEVLSGAKDGSFYMPTVIMGDLRLQTFEKAGWFYAGEVTSQDRNLTWGDVSIIAPEFIPSPATHSLNNHSSVSVMADAFQSTVINGYYVDRIGIAKAKNILYKVKMYIEVELENCKP